MFSRNIITDGNNNFRLHNGINRGRGTLRLRFPVRVVRRSLKRKIEFHHAKRKKKKNELCEKT